MDKKIKVRRDTCVREKTTGRVGIITDFYVIPNSNGRLVSPETGGLFLVRFDDNELVEEEKFGNELEEIQPEEGYPIPAIMDVKSS